MVAILKHLVPLGEERKILGKFYLSSFISELFNIVLPFQFAFLLLALDRPEWAFIPLIVEGFVVFLFEIPTGVVADKWGRKKSVIIGDLCSSIAWVLVPASLLFHGWIQLFIVCLAFAIEGFGQTLVSGAEEAWVMDNLVSLKKEKLTDQYFARDKSLSSLGGIVSGLAIWLILSITDISTGIISTLWIISAFGQMLSALIQMKIPEHVVSVSESESDDDEKESIIPGKEQLKASFNALLRIKPLFAFLGVTLVVSFVTAITGDAFEISMITKGLNPKELAPLAVLTDVLGFIAPLLVLPMAKHFGAPRVLAALLVLPIIAVLFFFNQPGLITIVGLYLFFNFIDDLWDPIADAMLQSYIPSSIRATLSSIINQLSELMGLLSLAIFTLMLGKESERVKESIPDLVEAFQGARATITEMPKGAFGLPIQDYVLVLFTIIGLLGAIILIFYPWASSSRTNSQEILKILSADDHIDNNLDQQDKIEEEVKETIFQKEFIKVKNDLDKKLDHFNPGEELTWWVSREAFNIPSKTTQKLQEVGPALQDFFRVANNLFNENKWIQKRLEKKFSTNYSLLNHCQPEASPRLIRPDVVCDKNWLPKLVELEITVGARADTAIMAKQYGLSHKKSLIRSYAKLANGIRDEGKNLALITAPHPFFQDLPDDAKSFAAILKEDEGVSNIIVLTDENLSSLVFDGNNLILRERFKEDQIIHVVDRFVDIYEIAELQHPGMGAILDAYLANAITDINTIKQYLDEKDWMSLFWEPSLQKEWKDNLGDKNFSLLRELIPKTWIITPELRLVLSNNEEVSIHELSDIRSDLRQFVIKESGTSTTASGAQSFFVLSKMDKEEISDLLKYIFSTNIEFVLQELVESPRMPFHAIDPETDKIMFQKDARFKMSPFYIDGELSDIRYVASNKKYAVNDEECVISVIDY